ncbi:MAG: VirB3 family type IV secretion system protein [Holosporaceae bacterium]|jgi:type IV secretion system protein VirB3|nr:VirB3 family type IV secretion system protein [Holosporaceae bacterium]
MGDELRRVPLHRALTRHQLLAGCDRSLFLTLLLFGLLLIFSGLMAGYLYNILFALILWFAGLPVLAKLAIYDNYFKDVVMRSIRYTQTELPACGKVGSSSTRVLHKRWS